MTLTLLDVGLSLLSLMHEVKKRMIGNCLYTNRSSFFTSHSVPFPQWKSPDVNFDLFYSSSSLQHGRPTTATSASPSTTQMILMKWGWVCFPDRITMSPALSTETGHVILLSSYWTKACYRSGITREFGFTLRLQIITFTNNIWLSQILVFLFQLGCAPF